MTMSSPGTSAKVLQFPQARRVSSDAIEASRRSDHVRTDSTKAIYWDAWYHQEAIVEQRPAKV